MDKTNKNLVLKDTLRTKTEVNGGRYMEINIFDTQGKVFAKRKSILTRLSHDTQISSMYNFILSLFIYANVTAFVKFIMIEKRSLIQIYIHRWVRMEYGHLMRTWLNFFLCSLLVYVISYLEYLSLQRFRKYWLGTYIIYQVNFFIWTSGVIHQFDLLMISKFVLTVEQVRMSMKMFSFFRENIRLRDDNNRHFPAFSHFLYFYFAPTAVYRDIYPRKRFNLLKTIEYGFKCLAALNFIYLLLEHILIPRIYALADTTFTVTNVVYAILINSIPATFLFVTCVFYFYLHSFLNLWAEILTFGDRLYYLDWWNSVNYTEFFKNWNIVVGDWLKTYIFYDSRGLLSDRIHHPLASMLVISFSSLIHEYILYMAMGSLCPVVSVTFGIFGLLLKYLKPDIRSRPKQETWNFIFWITFFMGNSINVTLYMLEANLATNCAYRVNSFMDYLRPKLTIRQCYGADKKKPTSHDHNRGHIPKNAQFNEIKKYKN